MRAVHWKRTGPVVLVVLVLAACASTDSTSSSADSTSSSAEVASPEATSTPVETSNTPATAAPAAVPFSQRDAVVVCDHASGLGITYVDPATGEVLGGGQYTDESGVTGSLINGESTDVIVSLTPTVCGFGTNEPKDLSIWNSDYSRVIVVSRTQDARAVFALDLEQNAPVLLVEVEPESDFGGSPASAMAATYMPDGEHIIWQEQKDSMCRNYIAPGTRLIRRADLDRYLVGETEKCGAPITTKFRFAGDQPYVCLNTGCYDPATYEKFIGDLDETPSWAAAPPSSRFQIDTAVQSQDGTTFFVAEDNDSDVAYLYRWTGEGSEPVEVLQLGHVGNNYSVLDVIGPNSPSDDVAAPDQAGASSDLVVTETGILALWPDASIHTDGSPMTCGDIMVPAVKIFAFPPNGPDSFIEVFADSASANVALESYLKIIERAAASPVKCTVANGEAVYESPSSVEMVDGGWEVTTTYFGFTAARRLSVCGNALVWDEAEPPTAAETLGCT